MHTHKARTVLDLIVFTPHVCFCRCFLLLSSHLIKYHFVISVRKIIADDKKQRLDCCCSTFLFFVALQEICVCFFFLFSFIGTVISNAIFYSFSFAYDNFVSFSLRRISRKRKRKIALLSIEDKMRWCAPNHEIQFLNRLYKSEA